MDKTESSPREATKSPSSRLPLIDLPKFSGTYSEWESFRETFGSLVESDGKLTDTLKFHYLKSCVSDKAAKLISNLTVTDDNYAVAWKLLTKKYENKRALIHSHLESFICFPAIKFENLGELRKLRDTVAAARAALTNLGSPIEHWDHIIVFIMSMKFSPETRREWNKTRGKSTEYE